jgi:hypothetical protein
MSIKSIGSYCVFIVVVVVLITHLGLKQGQIFLGGIYSSLQSHGMDSIEDELILPHSLCLWAE